ncbi:trypsin-like peptidase domain-containing protein [Ruficoccus amylovorans]|uniref:Trypsin-like peptidase domain-containing protein n=1 Tax=Ruficoccus amylovorans TaxID=1804625 RepID=A0A842HDE1_9BACT|nr:serine protease [Ruficoccus amylovorans]MBC2593381.1 trypsin-like peptidase domain-containing protein [Ruficoccus amylovorans]
MRAIRLLPFLLLLLLAAPASRAESYVALPNSGFVVRYPIDYPACKIYPSQSFEVLSEDGDSYFVPYDFGDAVHVVELPKKKNGRTVSFRDGNTAHINGMVMQKFEKGVILIEKGTAYPVTKAEGGQLELIVPVGDSKRRAPFPENLFRLVEAERYREASERPSTFATTTGDTSEDPRPSLSAADLEKLAAAEKEKAARVHASQTKGRYMPVRSTEDAVGVVTTAEGSGTGFLCHMDGVVYFFTNSHVVGSGEDLTIRLRDGTKLKPRLIELAEDRDLARISIEKQPPSLTFTTRSDIGDDVIVYGNSAGAGVITKIKGEIKGDAYDRIETSAKFVPGNSGSPIVNRKGVVVAVATYATFNPTDKKDWVMAGTGFDKVRRFGVKLDDKINWIPFHPEALQLINHQIIEAEAALDQSASLMAVYYNAPFEPVIIPGIENPRLAQWITAHNAVVKEYAALEGKRYSMSERNKVLAIIRNRGRAKGRALTDFFRDQAEDLEALPLVPRTGFHAEHIKRTQEGFSQLAEINESITEGMW